MNLTQRSLRCSEREKDITWKCSERGREKNHLAGVNLLWKNAKSSLRNIFRRLNGDKLSGKGPKSSGLLDPIDMYEI
jgi:hypothetical protein